MNFNLVKMTILIFLLKTNEFPLDVSQAIDWSRIHQHPQQQQLKESYDALVFNPVNEMLQRSHQESTTPNNRRWPETFQVGCLKHIFLVETVVIHA